MRVDGRPRGGAADRRARRRRLRPGRTRRFRPALLGAALITVAALIGGLLTGAVPQEPAGWRPGTAAPLVVEPPPVERPVEPPPVEADAEGTPRLAESMIYSGLAALGLSISGLVMVGRRRRLW